MSEQPFKADSLLQTGYLRVLLVEDDSRIVDFVRRGLKAEGYTVEVARNGQEARLSNFSNSGHILMSRFMD